LVPRLRLPKFSDVELNDVCVDDDKYRGGGVVTITMLELGATKQLFGMFAVLGALQASTQILLAVAPSSSMVMVTTHQQIVLNAFSYSVLHLVREAVGTYFQRRQLGAESSGGMLPGAARGHRGPPPKVSMARTMISKHNRERLKVGCRHP